MYDRLENDGYDNRRPEVSRAHTPLPPWLADRLLREGEKVEWVRGPWLNPWWERYATHPALMLVALAVGAACVGVTVWMARTDSGPPAVPAVAGVSIVLGTIFVLGLSCGYFTRLVVTNFRLVILQGYEVCRSWAVDDLPRSLTRYGRGESEEAYRSVDLDAVKTMLGGASDKFTESKTILAFGKQLERIKAVENDRPDPRQNP